MEYTVEQDGAYWLVCAWDEGDADGRGLVPPYFAARGDAERFRDGMERYGWDYWDKAFPGPREVVYPSALIPGRR